MSQDYSERPSKKPPTSPVYHVRRLEYNWFHSATGVCDLKIYNAPNGQQIAIVSDLVKTNGGSVSEGPSITNAFEWIATKVRTELALVPDIWIEYYPDRGYKLDVARALGLAPQFEETFALVLMSWGNSLHWKLPGKAYGKPEWKPITRAEVEALIGEPFSYEYQ